MELVKNQRAVTKIVIFWWALSLLAGVLWFVVLIDYFGVIGFQFSIILPAVNCVIIPFAVAFLVRCGFRDSVVAAFIFSIASLAIVAMVITPLAANLFREQSPLYGVMRVFYSNPYSPAINMLCGKYSLDKARSLEPIDEVRICDSPVISAAVVLPLAFFVCVSSMWTAMRVRQKVSGYIIGNR